MELYLVRHGRTSYNNGRIYQGNLDIELDETGRRQAELTGARLAGHQIEAIYSSGLKRARETGVIINRHLEVELLERSGLREIDVGEWQGKSWAEVRKEYTRFYREWERHQTDLPYPGGESGADVQKRAMEVVEEILRQPLKNVLIVTHGGVIRTLLSSFLGLGLENRFKIATDNCDISIVRYHSKERGFMIRTINNTSHLETGREDSVVE